MLDAGEGNCGTFSRHRLHIPITIAAVNNTAGAMMHSSPQPSATTAPMYMPIPARLIAIRNIALESMASIESRLAPR